MSDGTNAKVWEPMLPRGRGLAPMVPPLYRPPYLLGGGAKSLSAAITGFSNQSNEWGAKPIVVGDVVSMKPPLNGVPYLAVENVYNPDIGRYENRLYLHSAFNFGPGPVLIFNPRIGDLPFNTTNFPYSDIQYNYGRLDDHPQTLYPYDIAETQYGSDKPILYNKEVVELVPQECDWIEVIIAFPDGLKSATGGVESSNSVTMTMFARNAVTGVDTTLPTFTYTAQSTPGFYATTGKMSVPRAKYYLHLKRTTANGDPNPPPDTSNYSLKTTQMFALQGSKNSPPWTLQRDTHGQPIAEAIVACKIAAFLQFPKKDLNASGTPIFTFDVANLIAVWNGTNVIGGGRNIRSNDVPLGSNTYGLSNNDTPAWIAFNLLCSGGMNGMSVDSNRVDLPSFLAWSVWCQSNGYGYSNVLDQDRSCADVLNELCMAGRASWHDIDGKIGIVIEKLRTDPPVQHFTPRNSWNFKFQKAWPKDKLPHAMKCQFLDYTILPEPATNEVIVFRPGYSYANATRYISQEFPGVHSTAQIGKIASYQLAIMEYRPTKYTFEVETDGLFCHRGDLVMVSSDVLWDQQFGRIVGLSITSGNITAVTLDETITFDDSVTYALRFRTADGTSIYRELTTTAGPTNTLTLATTVASGSNSLPQRGDLVQIGPIDVSPAKEMLIEDIAHSNNLTATITCVDYAPYVYYVDGTISPPGSGQITYEHRDSSALSTPTSTGHVIDVNALTITFTMNRPPQHDHVQDWQYEYSSDNGTTWSGPTNTNTYFNLIVVKVPREGSYAVRIRTVRDGQYVSAWLTITNILVGRKILTYQLSGRVRRVKRLIYAMTGDPATTHTP